MTQPLTIQEMFNRAVIGLASQGFERCTRWGSEGGGCLYADDNGRHCAWGWVDRSIPRDQEGTITTLKHARVGLAADLDVYGLQFAHQLQDAHDHQYTPREMKEKLVSLASSYNLTIPPELDTPQKAA